MTDVRTFKAATMQEALELVRREMGTQAIILHTRHLEGRGLLPWWKKPAQVEITAGLGVNVRRLPATASGTNKAQTTVKVASQTIGRASSGSALRGAVSTREQTAVAKSQRTVGKKAISPAVAALRKSPAPADSVALSTAAPKLARTAASLASSSPAVAARPARPEVTAAESSPPSPSPATARSRYQFTPRVPLTPASASASVEPRPAANLTRKLDVIQRMLENLGRSGQVGAAGEIPDELFHLYTELIDAEVENDLARDLIFRLKRIAQPAQLRDAAAARALLTALVESEIRISPPLTARHQGGRRVVALIGSTGVGKTTTIAKLSANLRLRDGVRMGLVTVDTYRVAAVEQLRTYAEIIDLPMKVVTTPGEMRRAMDELLGLDLVLIDTAGRSPRDDLQIRELKNLLDEAHVDEVHLVMSMTSSVRSLESAAKKFEHENPTALIVSKLDEAVGMGGLLSLARITSLPFSYLTTGQDVPDDIEPANATRIARLVLGRDRIVE